MEDLGSISVCCYVLHNRVQSYPAVFKVTPVYKVTPVDGTTTPFVQMVLLWHRVLSDQFVCKVFKFGCFKSLLFGRKNDARS